MKEQKRDCFECKYFRNKNDRSNLLPGLLGFCNCNNQNKEILIKAIGDYTCEKYEKKSNEPQLNIYHVYRTDWDDVEYDEYYGFIVVAKSEEEALDYLPNSTSFDPEELTIAEKRSDTILKIKMPDGWDDTSKIKVKLIGFSSPGFTSGQIICSDNRGA